MFPDFGNAAGQTAENNMQSNQQRYIDFLSTMGKYHKYGLTQQINLFFHVPANASGAVATKAIWEKLGRKVADNARPIPIITGSEYQEHEVKKAL
ncbi:MAG: hypothetical protein J5965_04220 [Aeriscardovia sp.]|nr:hypothetical protein [Aeriscardovia sp.]MBO6202609.1 hypothetical protein [Selenomonas sp.]